MEAVAAASTALLADVGVHQAASSLRPGFEAPVPFVRADVKVYDAAVCGRILARPPSLLTRAVSSSGAGATSTRHRFVVGRVGGPSLQDTFLAKAVVAAVLEGQSALLAAAEAQADVRNRVSDPSRLVRVPPLFVLVLVLRLSLVNGLLTTRAGQNEALPPPRRLSTLIRYSYFL